MATVNDLITGSLRLIEEIGAGQTISAEDSADGLSALIAMIDSWSIQGGAIYTETIEQFALTGATSYTMGSGGNFNTTRPTKVRAVNYYLSGADTFEERLDVLSMEEYAYQRDKTVNGYAKRVYYSSDYPLAKLYFHPIPTTGFCKIFSEKPLTNYTATTDNIVLPPGYERALRYNLAVELAPEYGKQASQTIMMIAAESKNAVENKNMQTVNNSMFVDDGLINIPTFNIFNGQ